MRDGAVLFIKVYPSNDIQPNCHVWVSLCVAIPTNWTHRLICYTFILGISLRNIVLYYYVKDWHVSKQIHNKMYSVSLFPPHCSSLSPRSFKFYFMLYPFLVFSEYIYIYIYLHLKLRYIVLVSQWLEWNCIWNYRNINLHVYHVSINN